MEYKEKKYTGKMVHTEIEELYAKVREKYCKKQHIPGSVFDQICGVVNLGWCYSVVDEKKWMIARLKYSF